MIRKLLGSAYRKWCGISLTERNQSRRDEWVKNALAKLPDGAVILDAGAGEQIYRQFCDRFSYVSQDFAKYDGTGDSKGLQTGAWDVSNTEIISDITDIPVEDASFDAILCTEVFEHLPDPVLALKEFSRILKVGGSLILTAPFCSLTHFAPYHFYSGFNRYFYEHHLDKFGFEIKELSRNGNYFDYLAQELKRLRHCSKVYAGGGIAILRELSIAMVLRGLSKMIQHDSGSEELLCFGYHVFAEKVGE